MKLCKVTHSPRQFKIVKHKFQNIQSKQSFTSQDDMDDISVPKKKKQTPFNLANFYVIRPNFLVWLCSRWLFYIFSFTFFQRWCFVEEEGEEKNLLLNKFPATWIFIIIITIIIVFVILLHCWNFICKSQSITPEFKIDAAHRLKHRHSLNL